MKISKILFVICCSAFFGLFSLETLQIIPVSPGAQPNFVQVKVVLPEEGRVINGQPGKIEVRVKGYDFGDETQLPRAREISSALNKESLHVIVDNHPYFIFDGLGVDPLDEENVDEGENYYLIQIPFPLSNGLHVLRIFPARSYGEGLKMSDNFALSYFYVNKKSGSVAFLKKPFLTYNEPTGTIVLKQDKPILLDFYVYNAELSADGYKIDLLIDDTHRRMITDEKPHYIYGLSKGEHRIEMRLLDEKNEFVEGPFNEVKRTFTLN